MTFREFMLVEAAMGLNNFKTTDKGIPLLRVKLADQGRLVAIEEGTQRHDGMVQYRIVSSMEADEVFDDASMTHGTKVFSWHADVQTGWGPFMYDLCMEIATMKGGWLVSHTLVNRMKGVPIGNKGVASVGGDTSEKAEKVYMYYYKNRSDVESSLPPIVYTQDYITQSQTEPWMLYMYRKQPTTLQALVRKNNETKKGYLRVGGRVGVDKVVNNLGELHAFLGA